MKEYIRHKTIKFCMYMFEKCVHKHCIDGALKFFKAAIMCCTKEERNEVMIYLDEERDKLNKEARK